MRQIIIFPFLFLSMVSCNDDSKRQESVQNQQFSEEEERPEVEAIKSPKFIQDSTVKYVRYSDNGLVEDFNGDGHPDLVTLVANSKTNEIGVRIVDGSNSEDFKVFGAGIEVQGMTNLRWIESLETIRAGQVIQPTLVNLATGDILGPDTANSIVLRTMAFRLIPKEGHSSGVIYWNETDYYWMHQE